MGGAVSIRLGPVGRGPADPPELPEDVGRRAGGRAGPGEVSGSQEPMNMTDAHRAADVAARDGYGRLVAYLSARSRDVAAAEDALGEAFRAALETWPRDGVPEKPADWLLAVARRQLIDDARHERVKSDASPALRLAAERRQAMSAFEDDDAFPDER